MVQHLHVIIITTIYIRMHWLEVANIQFYKLSRKLFGSKYEEMKISAVMKQLENVSVFYMPRKGVTWITSFQSPLSILLHFIQLYITSVIYTTI